MRFRVSYAQMRAARDVFGQNFRIFFYEAENVFTMVATGAQFSFFLIHEAGVRPAAFATDFPTAIAVAGID